MNWKSVYATCVENGSPLVVGRPALVMEFFGRSGPASLVRQGEALLERFLSVTPSESQLFVLGNKDKRYKQLTPQSLRRIHKVLSERGAFYSLKTAPKFEVGDYSCELSIGSVSPWNTDRVVLGFPLVWGEAPGVERAESFFFSMVREFPFWGAVASFGFNMVWGNEFEQVAMSENFRLARRFHGLLVRSRLQESALTESSDGNPVEKLKSVGWLTFLDARLCERVGGFPHLANSLCPEIEITTIGEGVVLKTGQTPPIGDVNRLDEDIQPLRRVGRALTDVCISEWRYPSQLHADPDTANAWLHRFD